MRLTIALCGLIGLNACATITESRFNPFNWFGPSETVATSVPRAELRPLVVPSDTAVVIDNRVLVTQVTSLRVDRTPGGAIVTAQGLAPAAGYFNAQLVRRSLENGVMTFDFRAEAPATPVSGTSAAARQITVATEIDEDTLFGVRTIVVAAQSGSRQVSR